MLHTIHSRAFIALFVAMLMQSFSPFQLFIDFLPRSDERRKPFVGTAIGIVLGAALGIADLFTKTPTLAVSLTKRMSHSFELTSIVKLFDILFSFSLSLESRRLTPE